MKKIICNGALTVLLAFTSSQSFGQVDCSVDPDSKKYTFIGSVPPTAEDIALTEASLEELTVSCNNVGGYMGPSSSSIHTHSYSVPSTVAGPVLLIGVSQ